MCYRGASHRTVRPSVEHRCIDASIIPSVFHYPMFIVTSRINNSFSVKVSYTFTQSGLEKHFPKWGWIFIQIFWYSARAPHMGCNCCAFKKAFFLNWSWKQKLSRLFRGGHLPSITTLNVLIEQQSTHKENRGFSDRGKNVLASGRIILTYDSGFQIMRNSQLCKSYALPFSKKKKRLIAPVKSILSLVPVATRRSTTEYKWAVQEEVTFTTELIERLCPPFKSFKWKWPLGATCQNGATIITKKCDLFYKKTLQIPKVSNSNWKESYVSWINECVVKQIRFSCNILSQLGFRNPCFCFSNFTCVY